MGGSRDVSFVHCPSDPEPGLVSEPIRWKISAGTYPDAGCKYPDACGDGASDVQWNHHVKACVCISSREGRHGGGKEAPSARFLLGIFTDEPAYRAALGHGME